MEIDKMKPGNLLGVGNTANIYEWQQDKIIKLFNKGYSNLAVEKEFKNAMEIRGCEFLKPQVYEMVNYNQQLGIIYDKIEGDSLLSWVIRTGDINSCAVHMAVLHKKISQSKEKNLESYKDFLHEHIVHSKQPNKEEILTLLAKLPDGDSLCHGDFHPGNIFINHGNMTVIDFMNLCHGHFLYDIARTLYLVEYTPLPFQIENREKILRIKNKLGDLYLKEMNVKRGELQPFIEVITAARLGECPNESLIRSSHSITQQFQTQTFDTDFAG